MFVSFVSNLSLSNGRAQDNLMQRKRQEIFPMAKEPFSGVLSTRPHLLSSSAVIAWLPETVVLMKHWLAVPPTSTQFTFVTLCLLCSYICVCIFLRAHGSCSTADVTATVRLTIEREFFWANGPWSCDLWLGRRCRDLDPFLCGKQSAAEANNSTTQRCNKSRIKNCDLGRNCEVPY